MEETVGQYAQIMGASVAPQQNQAGYAQVTNPAPDVSSIQKPAATPQELEQRKARWMEVLTNPNFIRAAGYMGTSLMQPIAPGQTKMGHLGQALNVGNAAFQMGEYAQFEQDMKQKEEARKAAESQANIGLTQAQTGLATQQGRKAGADANVAEGTVDARILEANQQVEKTKADIASVLAETDNKKRAGRLQEIELQVAERLKKIKESIPDATIRASIEAEYQKAGEEIKRIRAQTDQATAAAGASRAAAGESTEDTKFKALTRETFKALTLEEKKAAIKTKFGGGTTSGMAQQSEMWGTLYDKLPENDPIKKGKTREQFQIQQLSSAKKKDAVDSLAKYIAGGGDDPDVISALNDIIKQDLAGRKPAPAPGASVTPGGAVTAFTRDPKTGKIVPAKQ